MPLQSSNQDSSLEVAKAEQEDRLFSSRLSIRSGTTQTKIKTEKGTLADKVTNAVIVYNSVPADSTFKVISQKGERHLFERLSTPRPSPKIVIDKCSAIAAAARHR